MSYIEAIILGLLQGITEPLPISSSGHLELLQEFMKIDNTDLTYEVFLNFGSLMAIIILYRKLLKKIFSNTIKYLKTKEIKYKNDFKYFYLVFFASIPAAIIGFTLEDFIEKYFTNGYTTGAMLIVTAIFLFLIRNFNGKKEIADMKISDALFIGGAQSVALLPGISRSGATIVGSMFKDLKRSVAFDFSFLMYIPISLGVFFSKIGDISLNENSMKMFIGTLIAFIVTFFTTKWFKNIVVNGKIVYFSYYCMIVGIIALIIL
ncbi:MAG: undecaprenyl-diphosphate phosphatase [Bacilli bacterium]